MGLGPRGPAASAAGLRPPRPLRGRWPPLPLLLLLGLLAAGGGQAEEAFHNVSFAVVHCAEHAPNHLLASFRTPSGLGEAAAGEGFSLTFELLRTNELRFSTGGGGPCSVLAVAGGVVLESCELGQDRRTFSAQLFAPLAADAPHRVELQIENLAATSIRHCVHSAALGGAFIVKTGGRLNATTPPDAGELDTGLEKCCREDADSCFLFETEAGCEAAKHGLRCMPCAAEGSALGCPEFESDLPGYTLHGEEAICSGFAASLAGEVPDVATCAAACNASADCAAFAVQLSDGLCLLSSSACCPGDGAAAAGVVVYSTSASAAAACDGGLRAASWHARLSAAWTATAAGGDVVEYVSPAVPVEGSPTGRLLPYLGALEPGHIRSFSAAPMPDVGLVSASAGGLLAMELVFRLGASGEVPGGALLFAPMPVAPWDFGVAGGAPLLASDAAANGSSTAAEAAASVIFTDLPDSVACAWHRIGVDDLGGGGGGGGANAVRCTVADVADGALGRQAHSLLLSLPLPRDSGGFSAAWVLLVQGPASAGAALAPDAVAFQPQQPRLEVLASAVQVPQSLTVVQVSFVLGVAAPGVEVTVTAPEVVLGGILACGPVPGFPFPAGAEPIRDGTRCRLAGVATGEPSTEYRMRLETTNRGVMIGSKGVFTLSMKWESRSALVSAKDYYVLVDTFGSSGAVASLRVGGTVGPLAVHFETSATGLYEECQEDMVLQLSLLRPEVVSLRSASGEPLQATAEPSPCSGVVLETYSDAPGGFPAPAFCRWDAMTAAGDILAATFAVSQGFGGLRAGRKVAFVVLAEVFSGNALSAGDDEQPSLAVAVLCGKAATEAAELRLASPQAAAAAAQGGGGAAPPLERLTPAAGASRGDPLALVAADQASQGLLRLAVLATGLGAGSGRTVEEARLFALPLFGFALAGAEGGGAASAAVPASLRGWWTADGGGAADAEASEEGQGRRIGGAWTAVNCVDVGLPAAWHANLRALEVVVPLVGAEASGFGWTGFAAHPFVYLEVIGRTGAAEQYGDVLRLPGDDATTWWEQDPSLKEVALRAGSQMGGLVHRVDLLLCLGFRAHGAAVAVAAPAGVLFTDLGPPPEPIYVADAEGRLSRAPSLRVDAAASSLDAGSAQLVVPPPALWPATTYVYSLYVKNPAALSGEIDWQVLVAFSGAFPVPEDGAAAVARSAESNVGAEEGAFAVMPSLRGCSLSPSSMQLGALNTVRVSFSMPPGDALSTSYEARPFVITLLAPSAFAFAEPVEVSAVQNLPPTLTCDLPSPGQLVCQLPEGFAFAAGATYVLGASVRNPVVGDGGSFAELGARYEPGWALRLSYSSLGVGAASLLYALCEDIPRSPPLPPLAPDGTAEAAAAAAAAGRPFALFAAETQPLFFGVAVEPAYRLPWALSGEASPVAVTFQPTSPQLPEGAVLCTTAPLGWQWTDTASIDGAAAVVRRGTTRDLLLEPLPLDPLRPNQVEVRLTYTVLGGQVYGFLGKLLLPAVESDAARDGRAAANVWTLEFRDTPENSSSLVSAGNYEAVVRAFQGVRLRVVGGCAVLPLALEMGAPADVIFSFVLATALGEGEYVSVVTPPHFTGAEPCEDYFERAVPLPPDLALAGVAYPGYQALPPAVQCSWHAGEGSTAELRLTNTGGASVAAQAYLVAVRVALPASDQQLQEAQASHVWRVGSVGQSGGTLDAACEVEDPFRLPSPQQPLASAALIEGRYDSPAEPLMVLGFTLEAQVPSPAVITVRAPLGFRFRDSVACRGQVAVAPPALPAGYTALGDGQAEPLCAAGGAALGLPGPAFAPDARQPAPLLEGTLSFHVPDGQALSSGTAYAFGVALAAPRGIPWENTWYLDVAGHVGTFPGLDLMRFADLRIGASFPGLSLLPSPLPYNDPTVSLTLSATAFVDGAFLLLAVPEVFYFSGIQDVLCAPFSNFSAYPGGDACEVGADPALCPDGRCVVIRPWVEAAQGAGGGDPSGAVWLERSVPYAFTLRVQNPQACTACSPSWRLTLQAQGVQHGSEIQGFALVGGVAELSVAPTHQLGGAEVLLTVVLGIAGRLVAFDRVELGMPEGWILDPAFCASAVGQAMLVGLKAPPDCTETLAVLTVYEMDLPPLQSPQLQLALAAMAPSYAEWKFRRTRWLALFGADADPFTAPLPLEFAAVVRHGAPPQAAADAAVAASGAPTAAAKVQAYELLPNMAPGLELAVSSAYLSSRAALRVSFVPSAELEVRSNSVRIRSSLPYGFSSCRLLWEEPPDRLEYRLEVAKYEPAFMFQGDPRCEGKLYEAVLRAVFLDTVIKDRVTLYVANFTVPEPPYAAARSVWEVVLQRNRGTLSPERLDTALGVQGPGAFGRLRELLSSVPSGVDIESGAGFAGDLAAGASNPLTVRFDVAVQLLRGSAVRLVAPPGFRLLLETFQGISRHFARQAAASDVRLFQLPLAELHGSDAPADVSVDVLRLRVLADSAVGEVISFDITTLNPTALAEALEPYNRWLIETIDVSSDLVVNSNRMSWLSFVPRPAFAVGALRPRHAVTVDAATVVDVVLSVQGRVHIPSSQTLELEVMAPDSFVFAADCFDSKAFANLSAEEVGWEGSSLPQLPFGDDCRGIGRFAVISGSPPGFWTAWQPNESYRLALSVLNGDARRAGDGQWSFQLVAEAANITVVDEGGEEAAPAAGEVEVGPAVAVRSSRVKLWTGGVVEAFADLVEDDRVLVIDNAWLLRKGTTINPGEVVVLMAEGSIGVASAATLRNAPADDAIAPASEAGPRTSLVRLTAVFGYALESAVAAAGFGTALPGVQGLQVVAAVRLKVTSVLPLAAVRLTAPPNFVFSCGGDSEGGNLPLSQAAAPACRAIRDSFASTLLFSASEPAGFEAYPIDVLWWFAAPMKLDPPSGWSEERQFWEVELVDSVGEMRYAVRDLELAPVVRPNPFLLYLRVDPTYQGEGDATTVRLTFGLPAANYSVYFGREVDTVTDGFEFLAKVPRYAPLALVAEPLAAGTCEVEPPGSLLFPSDDLLGRRAEDPGEGNRGWCTRVRFPLKFDPESQELRPAQGELPDHFEFGVDADIRLLTMCRPPMPPCTDFFSLSFRDEELFARNALIAEQLQSGEIGKDTADAMPRGRRWVLRPLGPLAVAVPTDFLPAAICAVAFAARSAGGALPRLA